MKKTSYFFMLSHTYNKKTICSDCIAIPWNNGLCTFLNLPAIRWIFEQKIKKGTVITQLIQTRHALLKYLKRIHEIYC